MPKSQNSDFYPDSLLQNSRPSSTCLDPFGGVSHTPNQIARVRPAGREFALKARGSMQLWLDGTHNKDYSSPRAGPKCRTADAMAIYQKNRGTMDDVLQGGGHLNQTIERECVPKVRGLGADNLEKSRGKTADLFNKYGRLPLSSRCVPKVRGPGGDNLEKGRGSMHDVFGGAPFVNEQNVPRVRFGGADNYLKGRGDALRKSISMVPPSMRPL